VLFSGHEISAAGVATDSSKIHAIKNWVVPTNVKEVRRFMGLVGYYRRFVKNFGLISRCLFDLLKKGKYLCGLKRQRKPFSP
jgi:hypothetical protein